MRCLLKIVDFPAPVSPTSAACSPDLMVNDTASRAFLDPFEALLPMLSSYMNVTTIRRQCYLSPTELETITRSSTHHC